MQKTYDKIRSITLSLTCDHCSQLPSLPQYICRDLFQAPLHFDLLQPLPEDIHERVSPGKVLRRVREVIGKARSVPHAQTPVQHPTEPTAQASTPLSMHSDPKKSAQQTLTEMSKTTRTAEGGEAMLDVLLEIWRFGKDATKRHFERKSTLPHLNHQQRHQEPAEPAPLSPQEIDRICDNLLDQLDDFQKTELPPLYIDNFSVLRAQHVL